MMMERAKTAPAPEPASTSAEQHEKPAPSVVNASAEDRVTDLERRLNLLGGESDAVPAASATAASAPAASAPAASAPAAAPAKPKESQTGQNNPLLKRIQAAQERARQAEQKEKEARAAAAAEIERKKREEEDAKLHAAEQERIAKAQSALRSVAGRALEDKQKDIMMQLEGKTKAAPPAAAATAEGATAAIPIMKSLDLPPPSFDSMQFPPPKMQQPHMGPGTNDMVGHGMNSRVLKQPSGSAAAAPPSFDFVEQQMVNNTPVENVPPPPPPAPTAPSMSPSAPPMMSDAEMDHLHGVQPVAPPFAPEQHHHQQQPTQVAMPPPPSFAQFEQQQPPPTSTETPQTTSEDDEGIFDYDLDGNPLSSEQRQALLDEQRQLYENIMQEKAANDAAIARANADSFDLRSSSAAAAAMPGGSNLHSHSVRNQAMDSVGRDASVPPAAAAAGATAATEGHEGESAAAREERERRMVKIGNNQMVALHGQDRTKRAIKEGTAILVQCINCQNWMQVTDTATLMFCPVCQVVSPVIQQNEVLTKEEAIQLTMDRKLAEKLQAEAYAADDREEGESGEEGVEERGFFDNLFGGTSSPTSSATTGAAAAAAAGGAAAQQSDSWWNKISSIVSYGVAEERGNMGVTRPPGAAAAAAASTSQYPAERRGSPTAASINNTASRSPTHHEETRGLLSPVVVDGNEANLPSGRVAESKPLFSCIADSMSNAASAVFSAAEGDAQGNVHGVDASSLLITNAGRGVGDGAGDYSKLPDQE